MEFKSAIKKLMDIFSNFVFQALNRLWMVNVTLILNGSPQKIVQRCQITAPRQPIDIRISADYSIFENGARKIDCYVGCVASGPVLSKPNVVHVILSNFWKQKFGEHGTVTLAIGRNSLWVHWLLNDDVWIFWAPNATILLIDFIDLLPKQSKMSWKIGLIEWGKASRGSNFNDVFHSQMERFIFLIKPYFWKNIRKFFL